MVDKREKESIEILKDKNLFENIAISEIDKNFMVISSMK